MPFPRAIGGELEEQEVCALGNRRATRISPQQSAFLCCRSWGGGDEEAVYFEAFP